MLYQTPQAWRQPPDESQSGPLPAVRLDPRKVAVLLNRNARRVTDAVARDIERVVGSENLFYSRSLEEAESFCREIVQRGYGTVACGGGDGTLVRAYNLVSRYIEESNAWRLQHYERYGEAQARLTMPRFAFLALGTGNGLRRVVGAGNPISDLRRLVEDVPQRTCDVPLVAHHGEHFCFGGAGYDSLVLNDYNWLRAKTRGGPWSRLVQSVGGYFAAVLARTLPRALHKGPPMQVRVTSRSQAFYMDPRRGDAAVALPPGSVLYEGPASMVGAGTTPYFGYGLQAFPFAGRMPATLHLRIATMGPLRTLWNLPSLWRGRYRNPEEIFDFLARDVHVEFDRDFPFQHSGDDQGTVRNLDLKITGASICLVDLDRPGLPAPTSLALATH